ncbi:MAG: hypothetical protein HC895_10275 [Leptolyngbyaceae cyanobacterium SM1_3_5]|nr:hypothetical protein [Leptolyngbyaceae cyanobacterium SM1_3_5]
MMVCFKWKLLALTLLFLALPIVVHLGWQKWLVNIPQTLPSKSVFAKVGNDSFRQENYYEISVPLTASADEEQVADYRLWIPQQVKSLRGLIVKQHGCGDPAKATGLDHANDLQWQAFASKHQFALLGTKLPTIYPLCTDEAGVDGVAERMFLNALTALAQKSNHPELDKVPWILWGHSGGADWSMQMLHHHPNRVIAVVNVRCGGILFSSGQSEILNLAPQSVAEIRGVPVLWASGQSDPNVEECVNLPQRIFSKFRQAGASWAIALEANAAHEAGDTRLLAIPYLDAVLASRVSDRPTNLQAIRESQGWLGNLVTQEIAPVAQYKGNPLEAAWLPNEETARKWQQYNTVDAWSQVRDRSCRVAEKLFIFKALRYPAESCYPEKILPMNRPAAPTHVRAEETGKAEATVTWSFASDLENGLPSFRVYRNGSLVKTLKGQGHDFGDAPEPAEVVLEFCDQDVKQDALYTVSAFNSIGKSVSEPVQFTRKTKF